MQFCLGLIYTLPLQPSQKFRHISTEWLVLKLRRRGTSLQAKIDILHNLPPLNITGSFA